MLTGTSIEWDRLPNARQRVFYTQTGARLNREALAALGLPADASAYLCGPTQFMTDVRDFLSAAGLDPARIHSELFGALPPIIAHTRLPHTMHR